MLTRADDVLQARLESVLQQWGGKGVGPQGTGRSLCLDDILDQRFSNWAACQTHLGSFKIPRPRWHVLPI